MQILFRAASVAGLVSIVAACSSLVTGGDLIRPGEPTGIINVINGTSAVIDVVLISACDVGSYGLNRLPDGVGIGPGQSYTFTVSAGCWDVDAGSVGLGEARQRMQVDAGGGVNYTVTD
jgi:hypothetical protein